MCAHVSECVFVCAVYLLGLSWIRQNINLIVDPNCCWVTDWSHVVCVCVPSRHKEAYTWSNPLCCVHNVIVGKLWIEQYGPVEILNHRYTTDLFTTLKINYSVRTK